jgi:4'-phosphopantetheinyl transferase
VTGKPDLATVWIFPVDGAEDYTDLLDDGERARARAFQTDEDRRRYTAAHGTLRVLAARELGTAPEALTWIAGQHGKPEIAGLHTSLSHSAGLAAVAISTGRPVGVDIQRLVPSLDVTALADRFYPPDEASYVQAGPDPADRFGRLWARKEAVVKAAGSRLWANLTMPVSNDVVECAVPPGRYRVTDVTAPAGYRAALALAGSAPFVLITPSIALRS